MFELSYLVTLARISRETYRLAVARFRTFLLAARLISESAFVTKASLFSALDEIAARAALIAVLIRARMMLLRALRLMF